MFRYSTFTILTAFFLLCHYQLGAQNSNTPLPSKQKSLKKGKSPSITIDKRVNKSYKGQIQHKSGQLFKSIPTLTKPQATKKGQSVQQKEVSIKRSKATGLPIMLAPAEKQVTVTERTQVSTATYEYLDKMSSYLKVKSPQEQFKISQVQKDELGQEHVRLQQFYKGVPIYGSEIILHFRPDQPAILNGRYQPRPQLDRVVPSLTKSEAIKRVKSDIKTETHYQAQQFRTVSSLSYDRTQEELVVYPVHQAKSAFKLVWHITIYPNKLERWQYFIDAHSGAVIEKYNHTCTQGPATATATDLKGVSRTIDVYYKSSSSTYYMIDASRSMYDSVESQIPDNPVGAIWTVDANKTALENIYQVSSGSNTWNDSTTVSAHYNAGKAYKYYKNTHNRNSLNGQGGTIISVVHVTNDDGSDMDNAYWNGKVMAYGDGASCFEPLAKALDVAGHEMTHGVIENTANLEYKNESGAINESMADVFGAMIERNNWQLGEDVAKTSCYSTGALRDMSNPHNGGSDLSDRGWQPMHVSEKYTGDKDNGGVHINSGIPNYAYYLFAKDVTKSKAEEVYYRALTKYLTKSSKFVDLRNAVVQSTKDLYSQTEVDAVKAAFDSVGIVSDSGGNYQTDYPPFKGPSKVLVHGLPADPNGLYIVDTSGTSFNAITTTSAVSKATVQPGGDTAYFVGSNYNIRRILLDPNSPTETKLTDDNYWSSVAISDDGTKLAAVSRYQDTSIYVYDFKTGKWGRFYLYNPTYSQGISTGGPLFADAIEWHRDGEYLVYDAYNKIPNASGGQDYTYWDVGFIKVWEKDSSTWGSGRITKLYSSLPEGVSIGNPTFSNNSPYIVAFDYVDVNSATFALLGANIETGKSNILFNNTLLGYPTYSRLDDKMAFTARSGSGDTIIATMELNADKISASGSAQGFVSNAQWPNWYAKGNRPSAVTAPSSSSFKANLYPNPARDEVFLQYKSQGATPLQVKIYNIKGQQVRQLSIPAPQSGYQREKIALSGLPADMYLMKIRHGARQKTFKFLKK